MESPTPLEMSLHSCELRAPQAHTESTQAFIIKTVSKAPSSQATQVYLENVNWSVHKKAWTQGYFSPCKIREDQKSPPKKSDNIAKPG